MQTTWGVMLVVLLMMGVASVAVAQAPPVNHNTWSSGAALPTAVVAPGGVAVLKNEIYVVGGVNADGTTIADTQIYNPATNSWSSGVPLPTTLTDGVAAVVKNVLYVISGGDSIMVGGTQTNAVWAYSLKTKTWSAKAPIPTARQSMGVAVEKNIIYTIGGVDLNGDRLTTVESYNPETNAWTEEAPLLVGKSEPSVGLVGTTIVAADGYASGGWTGDNEGYDAATNTWASLTSDPSARNAACAGGIGPQLYAAGGSNGGNQAIATNESFNVSKNKWTTLAPMPQAAWFAGPAVYKGQLYCIGGTTAQNGGTILDDVQIYQP